MRTLDAFRDLGDDTRGLKALGLLKTAAFDEDGESHINCRLVGGGLLRTLDAFRDLGVEFGLDDTRGLEALRLGLLKTAALNMGELKSRIN